MNGQKASRKYDGKVAILELKKEFNSLLRQVKAAKEKEEELGDLYGDYSSLEKLARAIYDDYEDVIVGPLNVLWQELLKLRTTIHVLFSVLR